jgi:hypothetical protein
MNTSNKPTASQLETLKLAIVSLVATLRQAETQLTQTQQQLVEHGFTQKPNENEPELTFLTRMAIVVNDAEFEARRSEEAQALNDEMQVIPPTTERRSWVSRMLSRASALTA